MLLQWGVEMPEFRSENSHEAVESESLPSVSEDSKVLRSLQFLTFPQQILESSSESSRSMVHQRDSNPSDLHPNKVIPGVLARSGKEFSIVSEAPTESGHLWCLFPLSQLPCHCPFGILSFIRTLLYTLYLIPSYSDWNLSC